MRHTMHLGTLLTLAALAGCGGGEDDDQGLTSAEERQLDDAAARLDAAAADYEAELQQAPEVSDADPGPDEH